MALVATCFVLKCHFNNPSHTPLPTWMRVVILKWLSRLLKIDIRTDQEPKEKLNKKSLSNNEVLQQQQKPFLGSHSNVKSRNRTTESLDSRNPKVASTSETPISQQEEIASCRTRSPKGIMTPDADVTNMSCSNLERATGLGFSRSLLLYDVNNYREPGPKETSTELLRSLLLSQENMSRDISELVQMAHEQEEEEGKKEEWTLVAHIVDQFFFYFFIFGLIFFTLIVFMQAPNYVFE